MPFGEFEAAQFLVPELRQAISNGTHAADLIECLPDAVQPGDRVLVLGGGLGAVSTLIAKEHFADRVIVVEPDMRIAPYLEHVHALNGVSWVETVNAVPVSAKAGRVPFFARRNLRMSSLSPEDGDWEAVMWVPTMDLGLILSDERIDLLICDLPPSMLAGLACANLGRTVRILARAEGDANSFLRENETAEILTLRGFPAKAFRAAVLFDRLMHVVDTWHAQ